MELDIGKLCSYPYCGINDFLPFYCHQCGKHFCLQHRTCESHECICVKEKEKENKSVNTLVKDKDKEDKKGKEVHKKYPCIKCGTNTKVMMLCRVCKKNICPKHRFSDQHICIRPKSKLIKDNYRHK